jgi:UDP-N-acetylglucosamine--N-acetylmuramyl-(pentapeptide) pyrophosphoryl-undecaprenol N-acetylglucosamine transferase
MVVCYTGGGTLGHVYPALAVHQAMAGQGDYRAFWIGRDHDKEREAVEKEGIYFYGIRSGKLRRYWSLRNILDLGNIVIAFFQAFGILMREKPDVLFSKGGFVSVPPVWASALLGIPVISHESDTSPGLATRLNSRFSHIICTAYSANFPARMKKKMVLTGNPIRSELLQAKEQPIPRSALSFLSEGQKLILVLGGSSGSSQINRLIVESLSVLTSYGYVYHQCGSTMDEYSTHSYHRVPFIYDELSGLLTHADLVISRSGAGTISELAFFGCAALLIPLSKEQTRGDQIENARYLATRGSAQVVYDDINSFDFAIKVGELLGNEEELMRLSKNISALYEPQSEQKIANLIRERKGIVCSGA